MQQIPCVLQWIWLIFYAFYAFYAFLKTNPWVTGCARQGPAPICHPRIFLQKSIKSVKNVKMSQIHCKTQRIWCICYAFYTCSLRKKCKKRKKMHQIPCVLQWIWLIFYVFLRFFTLFWRQILGWQGLRGRAQLPSGIQGFSSEKRKKRKKWAKYIVKHKEFGAFLRFLLKEKA